METPITLTIHGATIALLFSILGILLKQHKIYVRIKDRLNQLWFRHCHETGDHFEPLENGK